MNYKINAHRLPVSLLVLWLSHYCVASDIATPSWEFQLAPVVLWGAGIDGDSTIGTPTTGLKLNFQQDNLDDIDTVYGARLQARKNEFTLFSEYQYFKLKTQATIGPVQTDIDFKNIMLEIGASFVFSDTGSTTLASVFGFRYIDQRVSNARNIEVSIPIPLPPNQDIDGGDKWWHPFMGLQLGQRLGDRWSFLARTDFGYAASDNKATNAAALIDFRFSQWGSVFAGYRYINFDYNQGNGKHRYAFQADQQGPELGFNLRW